MCLYEKLVEYSKILLSDRTNSKCDVISWVICVQNREDRRKGMTYDQIIFFWQFQNKIL